MPTLPSDAQTLLHAPLSLVDELFAASGSGALHTGASVHIGEALTEALNAGARSVIPSLNAVRPEHVEMGALVRLVGMVQDVRDPEYYAGVYEEFSQDGQVALRTSKYRDARALPPGAHCQMRNDCIWQRTPVVCIPIPARTDWAAAAIIGEVSEGAPSAACKMPSTTLKRAAEASEDSDDAGVAVDDDAMEDDTSTTKKPRAPDVCTPCKSASAETAFARSAPVHGSYLLKVYDGVDGDELRVNDLVEIYGVLDLNDNDAPVLDGDASMLDSERQLQPPASLQPRLHCVAVRRLEPKFHPLLATVDSREEALALEGARANVTELRGAVVSAFTSVLGGDALAAELMLLCAISRVLTHHGEMPLGKLTLNVSACPPAAGAPRSPVFDGIRETLSALFPFVSSAILTINELNTAAYVPAKDHDANCLRFGALQLPAGAALLVDETTLAPGQLKEAGVRNVGALSQLCSKQKLAFDFTYCAVEFAADVSVIVLSTAKSMLPCAVQVPLRVQPLVAPADARLSDDVFLRGARAYLGLAARAIELSVPAELAASLQEDFVASRAKEPDVTAQDFSHWLTCTRLHAASMLAAEVTFDHYAHVKQLDVARRERLRAAVEL